MVSALDRKLFRDLLQLRTQVLTIALVVACGIASFVALQSAYTSLLRSRDSYYDRYRFADVFARVERAPETLRDRIESINGVARVETRVVEWVTLPMPDMDAPARATLVSLPPGGRPALNDVHLVRGRLPHPHQADEVLLLERFAEEHGLEPGERIDAIVNGRHRELQVVGLAMSPEFVFTMAPGDLVYDPAHTAVVWINRAAAGAALDMEGAFNNVLLHLQPGASLMTVLDAVDRLLEPYGGTGAVGRARQPSHYMLTGELLQLEQLATTLPFIFLAVAAFLVNVVLSRLVLLQRFQIAVLKAMGYSDTRIGLHYLELVAVIGVSGALIGTAVGAFLGSELMAVYTEQFFRFAVPAYRIEKETLVIGIGVSLGAAVLGALLAVARVASLPPAEAMRPPAPAGYHRSHLRGSRLRSWLGPSARMALRELERRPGRALLSVTAIALSVGILVAGRFMYDAVEQLVNVHFHRALREDVSVIFRRPIPERDIHYLAHLPGVLHAEGLRTIPVRLRASYRAREAMLTGYPPDGDLRRLLDRYGNSVSLPPDGVMLTKTLGEILHVGVGDSVQVELLEGAREKRSLTVTGWIDEAFGLQGHMQQASLHRVLASEPLVTAALLRVLPEARKDLHRRLKEVPAVLSVSSPADMEGQFERQSGSMMAVFTFIITVFASVIAVGVIYNNARVALASRSRDLATLRVLGYTRTEVAGLLYGELALHVTLAIPLGLLLGNWMAQGLLSATDPETYRFPVVISPKSYAFAAVVTIASAVFSLLLVRRRIDRLDLMGVLKTRE